MNLNSWIKHFYKSYQIDSVYEELMKDKTLIINNLDLSLYNQLTAKSEELKIPKHYLINLQRFKMRSPQV